MNGGVHERISPGGKDRRRMHLGTLLNPFNRKEMRYMISWRKEEDATLASR